jgi:hypothetical protein
MIRDVSLKCVINYLRQILYGLQPTVNNLTQGVNNQIGNLLTQMNTLSDKFKSLDTPLGGSIPVSFNVLLAVFPLALSIVFCYLAMTLRDTIRLRRVLETGTNQNAKDFVSESPLWIDPKPPKNSINDYKLHTLAAWIVLAVPALLFVGSLIIISSIWFWMPITADKFPPFAAASEFNELIYRILYVLSGILFGFSYAMIIKK